ncbi:MAG: hypothetical protein EOO59_03090 [Hymenobacter sp.]|nr:MAG: hypothetical protein EOO59_03090 [Hymenobacter sp.]
MNWYAWGFYGWLVVGLPFGAGAQAPAGDGLQGAYYEGLDFERHALTRRDATIDFNWQQRSPAAGLPAEGFSVRWTGWLVPPTTGRYVLCLVVDDGMRLWLNDRQLLNEWRGQSLSTYRVAVALRAGVPYSLRVDYCQHGYDSRALLAWEPPGKPVESTWRNLWGTVGNPPAPATIPTRYLFSRNPYLADQPPPAKPVVAAKTAPPPAARRIAAGKPPRITARATQPRRPTTPASALASPSQRPTPDAAQAATIATRLAAGQAVTLRALYFEQGQAALLPGVQASLDTLAATLMLHPALRLEVQGHTDNQGDAALNHQLSQQRAEVVCRYLATHGIAAERLRPVGYGGTQPVADNSNAALRAQNRRVVLRQLP